MTRYAQKKGCAALLRDEFEFINQNMFNSELLVALLTHFSKKLFFSPLRNTKNAAANSNECFSLVEVKLTDKIHTRAVCLNRMNSYHILR